jgi:hypothetical protein
MIMIRSIGRPSNVQRLRYLSSEATARHKEMEAVLGSPPPSAAPPPPKNTFRASLINAGASFFAVVLAAQGLKNAHQKRAAQRELEAVVELLEEKRAILTALSQQETLQPMALQIMSLKRNWWSNAPQEEEIVTILQNGVKERIGRAAMTPEESDADTLRELQSQKELDANIAALIAGSRDAIPKKVFVF